MNASSQLELRVRRLEDRQAIADLVAAYCFAVDDRDIERLAMLFTRGGRFRSDDGVLDARGREAVIEQFHARFAVLGPSHHVTHDHMVRFDPQNPDMALGHLSSHAEVVRNGRSLIAALRYRDRYEREQDEWRFADRLLSFLYYVPAEEYAEALASPTRMRVYEEAGAADWPEGLESWQAYYGLKPEDGA